MAEKAEWVVRDAEALGQPSKGPSNAFEPAGDRPSNLGGTVLLHEVETSDDNRTQNPRQNGRSHWRTSGSCCPSIPQVPHCPSSEHNLI
jgi:hypothetical protein